jgi:hypothetical protein
MKTGKRIKSNGSNVTQLLFKSYLPTISYVSAGEIYFLYFCGQEIKIGAIFQGNGKLINI